MPSWGDWKRLGLALNDHRVRSRQTSKDPVGPVGFEQTLQTTSLKDDECNHNPSHSEYSTISLTANKRKKHT